MSSPARPAPSVPTAEYQSANASAVTPQHQPEPGHPGPPVPHRRTDLGGPALPQLVRDAVLAALRAELPAARVHGVAAGLHLTVTFDCDDRALAAAAAAEGVLVQALSEHRIAPGRPGLVIGYAAQPPDRLRRAVTLLARTARELAPDVNER